MLINCSLVWIVLLICVIDGMALQSVRVPLMQRFESRTQLCSKDPVTAYWLTEEDLSLEVLSTNPAAAAGVVQEEVAQGTGLLGMLQMLDRNRSRKLKINDSRPPILFIHGSYHAAWCWAENYFDFFGDLGHSCYAISLRGTSATGMPPEDTSSSTFLSQHVSDVRTALKNLNVVESGVKPIIVAHSFGGVVLMKLLADEEIRKSLAGVALLCSVPPSGNGPMTQRFIKNRPWAAFNIVRGFVLKEATTNTKICRELFFDDSVDASSIKKYMRRFQADSRIGLDLSDVSVNLPMKDAVEGQAPWLMSRSLGSGSDGGNSVGPDVNPTGALLKEQEQLPVLVVGAEKDFIVDLEGVAETARYFDVEPVIIPDMYHDVMLGPKFERAAAIIRDWWLSNQLL